MRGAVPFSKKMLRGAVTPLESSVGCPAEVLQANKCDEGLHCFLACHPGFSFRTPEEMPRWLVKHNGILGSELYAKIMTQSLDPLLCHFGTHKSFGNGTADDARTCPQHPTWAVGGHGASSRLLEAAKALANVPALWGRFGID